MAELTQQQKDLKEGWDAAKEERRYREGSWREVADFCEVAEPLVDTYGAPILTGGPSTVRRVYTGSGILNSKRSSALFVAYLVDPTKPFLTSNAEMPADMSGGFITQNQFSQTAKDFMNGVSWQFFYELMRPMSGFLTALAMAMRDFVNYGMGVTFSSLNEWGELRVQHIPLRNVWIRCNELNVVDTLYRRTWFRLDRLVRVYPQALENEKIRKLYDDGKKKHSRLLVQVVHGVMPREGGKKGELPQNKPVASIFFLPDYDCQVVKEEGFETFPYSVARNDATEDNPYGAGLSEAALPDLRALNHYLMQVEDNLDLTNEPPALYASGMFKKYSFNAGALTEFDPFSLPMGNVRDAFYQLPVAGQIAPAMPVIEGRELRVGEFYFTDWMRLRENGMMTATEVNDRRDLRIRGMSALLPGVDRDFLGHKGDRVMELKSARGHVPIAPQELRGRRLSWDYSGPLASAMRANQTDVLAKVLGIWQGLIKEAPEVADIIDIEAVLRNWVDGQGAEPGNLRSPEAVAERAAAREAAAADRARQEQMTAQATAMRDAAQGVASLANAGNGEAAAVAQQMAA